MFLSISGSPDPRKYSWYKYVQHKVIELKAKLGRSTLELEIDNGTIYGLRYIAKKWRLLDPDDVSASYILGDFDAKRLIANSKGWSGKVSRYKVNAGEGGMDTLNAVKKASTSRKTKIRMNSSMFSRGLYDQKKKLLFLVFKNGAVWQYRNVTKDEVLEFQNAKSQGQWYNDNIKGVKDGQRLDSLN